MVEVQVLLSFGVQGCFFLRFKLVRFSVTFSTAAAAVAAAWPCSDLWPAAVAVSVAVVGCRCRLSIVARLCERCMQLELRMSKTRAISHYLQRGFPIIPFRLWI